MRSLNDLRGFKRLMMFKRYTQKGLCLSTGIIVRASYSLGYGEKQRSKERQAGSATREVFI